MLERCFIGIDIGTYETKGTLTGSTGTILKTASRKHLLSVPEPGLAEQDPVGVWWREVCEISRELVSASERSSGEIAAVCLSAVSCGLVISDGNRNPLRPAILYGIDTRSVGQIEQIRADFNEEFLIETCGELPSVDSFGPKVLWLREREPAHFRKTEYISFAQGFVNLRMTGRNCIDRYSAFFAAPLYNYRTGNWNPEMCAYIMGDKPQSVLPEILSASEIIGQVTKEAAAESGIPAGTPVLCGTTDAGAEALSVGVVEPGDTMVMYGSTLFINHITPEVMVKNNPLWKSHSLLNDGGCILAGMATTGSLTRWLRDNVTQDLVIREKDGLINAYDEMFREVDSVPAGSEGVYVLPYFAGERMPIMDPNAKGMIFGLTLHHTRAHIIRAALEGIGYGLRQNFDVMSQLGVTVNAVTAVGGGTKSREWMQIMSDVTGVPHQIPEITIGASFGDTMLCAVGTGAVSKIAEIKSWNRIIDMIYPNEEAHAVYHEKSSVFAELYRVNRELMHADS